MDSKKCNKCNEEKLLCDYYKDSKSKLGLKSSCKSCTDIETGAYRMANLDKIKNRNKEFYKENRQRLIDKSLAYYRSNTEDVLLKRKAKYFATKNN